MWGVCENVYRGKVRARVTIFRNEGPVRSSELVAAATAATLRHWRRRYGRVLAELRTEVDPSKVRRKRDPGRCFLRAGWRVVGRARSHRHRGAIVLAFRQAGHSDRQLALRLSDGRPLAE